MERLVVGLAAALARISKAGAYVSDEFGGTLWQGHDTLGERQYQKAIEELKAGRKVTVKATYSRT